LVFVGRAGEEGTATVHLCYDAACGPDVNAGFVGAGSEEDVGGSVPEGDDFIGEGADRDSECSCETEICELKLPFVVDEEILGLEIAVQDSVRMAVIDSLEKLVYKGLDHNRGQCSSLALGVHILLQIPLIHVFED
jgi:hypothetical protein